MDRHETMQSQAIVIVVVSLYHDTTTDMIHEVHHILLIRSLCRIEGMKNPVPFLINFQLFIVSFTKADHHGRTILW